MPKNQALMLKIHKLTKGTSGKLYLSVCSEYPKGLNYPCLEFDPTPATLLLLDSMVGKSFLLKDPVPSA